MRIVSGSARGRKLKTPDNYDVRPTADSVKESVFNIIGQDIVGRRVLDLFAGTGQLGIEAISRGAAETVFVDISRVSLKIVRENLKICGFEARTVESDALNYLNHSQKFDIIFVDPPYNSALYVPVINKIAEIDLLTTGGIIIAEASRECTLPDVCKPYRQLKEYRYGKTKIVTYTREDS